jgi:hypothetical protein
MYDGSEPHPTRLDIDLASARTLAGPPGRPIFLHGLWRSGSTYLWSRFRMLQEARCFYEPLHHGLARLSLARIAQDTPEKIGGNRHPALTDPYFLEFAPLVGVRGVKFYREDLAYDRYALRPNEAHPRLERYVASLIDHADGEGRSAVLGFNRTGLRIAWLKARFPEAVNIHIDRDPAAIWASYTAETAKGNYAFFSMWFRVLMNNAEHPVFAPLVERLGLYRRAARLHGPMKAVHRQLVEGMSAAETYYMVYYLWLACTAHAKAECDLVIDTRRAGGAPYRREIEAEIAALTGFSIDLSDMRAAAPRLEPPATLRAGIEASAEACLPYGALPKTPVFPQRSPQRPILQRLDLHKAA